MRIKRINKFIRVVAFTLEGKMVKRFKSIHRFRKYFKKGRLHPVQLKKIRKGELILVGDYILGMSGKYYRSKANPLRCKDLMNKFRALKRRNIKKLKKFHETHKMIVMVNNELEILGYNWGSIKKLASREKVSVGTIKASLHWSAKGFFNNGQPAKYYIWLKDLPQFISHVEKSLCSK